MKQKALYIAARKIKIAIFAQELFSKIDMKSVFTILALGLLTFITSAVSAQSALTEVKQPSTYGSSNLKLMPALNVNTYGLAFEKPLTDRFSIEIMAGFKFSNSVKDGENAPTNDANKSGYLVDLTGKYYLGTAPEGWYLSATAGASNIIYSNGTVRPYAFNLNTKSSNDFSTASSTPNPGVFRYNVGGGYQWIMSSRRLIANIGFGLGGYSNSNGSQFMLLFTPSVGYKF